MSTHEPWKKIEMGKEKCTHWSLCTNLWTMNQDLCVLAHNKLDAWVSTKKNVEAYISPVQEYTPNGYSKTYIRTFWLSTQKRKQHEQKSMGYWKKKWNMCACSSSTGPSQNLF